MIIRDQEMNEGDAISWLDAEARYGNILSITPIYYSAHRKVFHHLTIKATNGDIIELRPAEHYKVNLVAAKENR